MLPPQGGPGFNVHIGGGGRAMGKKDLLTSYMESLVKLVSAPSSGPPGQVWSGASPSRQLGTTGLPQESL